MMEQKISKMNAYFEQQIALCRQRSEELITDERADEAVFEKIKANLYDIFRTVLSAAQKAGSGDPEAVRQFFIRKTQQIPSGWAAAHAAAKQHGDPVKLQIEQIKLDAAADIRQTFVKFWEEAE